MIIRGWLTQLRWNVLHNAARWLRYRSGIIDAGTIYYKLLVPVRTNLLLQKVVRPCIMHIKSWIVTMTMRFTGSYYKALFGCNNLGL